MLEEITGILENENLPEEDMVRARKTLLGMSIGHGNNLPDMIDRIQQYGVTIPTGYADIDMLLHGGIRTGVSVIAAQPRMGKSTFALQLAEQFSLSGVQTLYLCNDMSAEELTSKALSRNSFRLGGKKGFEAWEILGFRDGLKDNPVFKETCKQFQHNASMLRIEDGDYSYDWDQMLILLNAYSHYRTSQQVIVVIDYLQNIHVDGARNDKERVDFLMKELKRVAKLYKFYIIAISSINRASYGKPLTFESLKESGGIEYGSDLILGIQFEQTGSGSDRFDEGAALTAEIRDVELVVLKQRFGVSGQKLPLKFYPKYDTFPWYDPAETKKREKSSS